MAIYKYLRKFWKADQIDQKRLIEWRSEPTTVRVLKPTRLDRARSVGYKAKPGIIVIRQRVLRGGRQRPDIKKGRRSKHSGQRKNLGYSYQVVAEQRVARKHPNMQVLNSYYLAKDGKYYWYEVILADKSHPSVMKDKDTAFLASPGNNQRVFRGKTSAGKKSRGMRHKGKGAEKVRPSQRANKRLAK